MFLNRKTINLLILFIMFAQNTYASKNYYNVHQDSICKQGRYYPSELAMILLNLS